jgi:translation initiation factor 6
LGIHIYDIYRNPNVGIFSRASEKFLLIPQGYARQKSQRLSAMMGTNVVFASVGYTRLLGPLTVINSQGLLVSRFATDGEMEALRSSTYLKVERLDSRFSAVGNLVSVNDFGAVVSTMLNEGEVEQIRRVMGVPVKKTSVAGLSQVGSLVCASNKGALVHPKATDDEMKTISSTLQVECEPGSVNGGVPYVTSGLIVNSRAAIVGSQTAGPELFVMTKAFKL